MDNINVCRCCLAKGLHKDLSTPYMWLDKKEVYSDMLLECFNIILSSDGGPNAICDMCIKSLRSSLCFKQQVLKADMDFIKWAREKSENGEDNLKVKLEPEDSGDGNCVPHDTGTVKMELIEEDDDSDDRLVIDEDIPEIEEAMLNKTDINIESLSQKHRVKENNEEDDGLSQKMTSVAIRRKTTKADPLDTEKEAQDEVGDKPKDKWAVRGNSDKFKHRQNLLTVLQYSNATPFRNKTLLGYVCGYCDSKYPDPEDLRAHTASQHWDERLAFKSSFDVTEFNAKLDVTGLRCKLCDNPMQHLATLKRHLVTAHGLVIHEDIKDHLLEFRLSAGDVHQCALCPSAYEAFKSLKQHMNRHYGNYACALCPAAFATRRSLNAHRGTHQRGSFACPQCAKDFASGQKLRSHLRCQHGGGRRVADCPHCGASFRSYYQRNRHMVTAHDAVERYRCKACDKTYILKSLLMGHVRRCHLLEKECQCAECGRGFFSKKALNAHMVRHRGAKDFPCTLCGKAYARKYTLREHMRIHEDDRRFKCERCGLSFVQKCSLRSHMLSNHGLSVAARDIAST